MKIGCVYHNNSRVFLVTDVAKKQKTDKDMLYDDDWNEAKVGQKFIYMVSCRDEIYSQMRVKIEDCNDLIYLDTIHKCTCPKCSLYHPNWRLLLDRMNKENKILVEKLKGCE